MRRLMIASAVFALALIPNGTVQAQFFQPGWMPGMPGPVMPMMPGPMMMPGAMMMPGMMPMMPGPMMMPGMPTGGMLLTPFALIPGQPPPPLTGPQRSGTVPVPRGRRGTPPILLAAAQPIGMPLPLMGSASLTISTGPGMTVSGMVGLPIASPMGMPGMMMGGPMMMGMPSMMMGGPMMPGMMMGGPMMPGMMMGMPGMMMGMPMMPAMMMGAPGMMLGMPAAPGMLGMPMPGMMLGMPGGVFF